MSPDVGAIRLANHYAALLDLPVAICHKQRTSGTEVSVTRIIGDVAGRSCVIVDDMIDTAGSITEGAKALMTKGAKEVYVTATHGIFCGPAIERLSKVRGAGQEMEGFCPRPSALAPA